MITSIDFSTLEGGIPQQASPAAHRKTRGETVEERSAGISLVPSQCKAIVYCVVATDENRESLHEKKKHARPTSFERIQRCATNGARTLGARASGFEAHRAPFFNRVRSSTGCDENPEEFTGRSTWV